MLTLKIKNISVADREKNNINYYYKRKQLLNHLIKHVE